MALKVINMTWKYKKYLSLMVRFHENIFPFQLTSNFLNPMLPDLNPSQPIILSNDIDVHSPSPMPTVTSSPETTSSTISLPTETSPNPVLYSSLISEGQAEPVSSLLIYMIFIVFVNSSLPTTISPDADPDTARVKSVSFSHPYDLATYLSHANVSSSHQIFAAFI